jgi:hypothetical protein
LIVGGQKEQDMGNWDEEQLNLSRLREEFGVEDEVTFLGSLPHDQLCLYYNAAGMGILFFLPTIKIFT